MGNGYSAVGFKFFWLQHERVVWFRNSYPSTQGNVGLHIAYNYLEMYVHNY